MFASSRPVPFEPYGRRRRRGVPRWLLLLLLGTAIGAGAVVFVQERYLPPRLSADESTQLRESYQQAETERRRLEHDLAETSKRLNATLGENKSLADALAESRSTAERLRQDVASVIDALPPDPRGGAVQVRAARLDAERGALTYDVLLSRERSGAKALSGVMQLVVSGSSARGADARVAGEPVALSIAGHQSLRGSMPLPEGYKPRQATINVLDRVDGKLLGKRVINVK